MATERIEQIRREATEAIRSAGSTTGELEELRVRYLGRKAELTQILRGIAELPPEERGPVGKSGNEARGELEALLERRSAELDASELGTRLAEDAIDVTLPGAPPVPVGAQNPLIRTQREIEDIFVGLGYRVMEGPEVELDYYNFTALNHPPGHPARMAQDTFYVDPATLRRDLRIPSNGDELPPGPEDVVLRTHTSPMQVRSMESAAAADLRSSCPAAATARTLSTRPTARSSTRSRGWPSARTSHSPTSRARSTSSRGRSSVPSARPASDRASSRSPSRASRSTSPASAVAAAGSCPTARATRSARGSAGSRSSARGWSTPNVFGFVRENGYDPEEIQGFAFGMGIERIAMLKYGVPDLRKFFENDVRVLEQFR